MAKKEVSFRKIYNHDIRKANPIATSAAFDYSLIEEKMVDYVSTIVPAPQINNDGEIKYPLVYVIYYSHFCKCTGKKGSNSYYKAIDQSLENLRDKSIKLILSDKKTTLISFLERVEFNEGSKRGESRKAIIKLDDRIIPILIEKKKNYFEHHPEYTMLMDSKYSIRLYQWILALYNKEIGIEKSKSKFQGQLIKDIDILELDQKDVLPFSKKLYAINHKKRDYYIHIDDLKEQLSISKNYRGFETIKERIIEPSIEENNEKTDLNIDKKLLTINDDGYIHFSVERKSTEEMSKLETTLTGLINNITIRPSEISHVMENEDEYEVEQYELIEKWAETM